MSRAGFLGTLLLAAVAACEPHDVLGTGWDLPGLEKVYRCELYYGVTYPEPGMMRVEWLTVHELCWDRGASSLESSLQSHLAADLVSCRDTPRHLGPCIYGCEPHSGCNAMSSCWCPPAPEDED